jgi:hypothetical protein
MSENSNGNYLPDDEFDEQEQPQPAVALGNALFKG